jgi:hypothetical protein
MLLLFMKQKLNYTEPGNPTAPTPKAEDIQSLGLFNKAQLASELHVTTRTISNWQTHGHLPFIKVGNRCLYPKEVVLTALQRKFGHNMEVSL